MPYPAHVSAAYCYDGSYAGFLCCIFESYTRCEIPSAVLGPAEGQTTLFGTEAIATDPTHARRVANGLTRLGPMVRARVMTGFLSTEEEKDLILLRFARRCFDEGPRAVQMLGDPDVHAAFVLERNVNNEVCPFIEFIRFEEKDGMLGSVIHPKNNVLPLLRGHFCSRLPDEDFLIFDAAHGTALLRQSGHVQYLAMEHYEPARDADELNWQALWKRFFHALTIEERPAVKLAGGELNIIRFQLDTQLDDFINLVDVVAMKDKVQHHRVVARFYRFRHRQLLLERFFVARQRRVKHFIAGLEANLDMVQPGLAEGVQFALRQPYPGGDQVGIEPEVARGADQLRQIFTGQRLAAGKAQLNAAHRPRLAKDLDPLFGGQLLILPGEVQRIGTVGTLQRAAVGQLCQQPQRRIDGGFTLAHGR